MIRIAAVILAGGRGERLGGANKALLEFGGERLVDRALAAAAGCAPILLAVGHADFTVDGARAIRDLDADYAGPLAGVAAAVEALAGTDAELLLSLAVDTPFFPHDFAARAAASLGDRNAAIGAYAAQDYPTNGLWRLASLQDLPRQVRQGIAPHSLKRLAATLDAIRLDYAAVTENNPFDNANTPTELDALRRRFAEERRSS